MTKRGIHQTIFLLITCCYFTSAKGQIIKMEIKQEFYTDISEVEHSFLKKEDALNAIVYSDATKDLFLIKDSLHWKGYLFRNTIGPEGYVMNGNDDTVFKPIKTILYHFNGDSLYEFLYTNKIYSLKQFDDDQIAAMYAKNQKAVKGTMYGFGYSSHDSDVTITIPPGKKNITYRRSLIDNKDLHFIPTLKTFFLLGQIVKNTY